ncbi:hypothetical protein NX021_25935 [Cytobacillus firmus]|nr:hypothetical protein [Cytobacillus firmus]
MIAVERVSRILNHFNIAFTESAVLSLLNRGILRRGSRIETGYYSRNTKYGYSIDQKSLEEFLIGNGIIEKDINDVLA